VRLSQPSRRVKIRRIWKQTQNFSRYGIRSRGLTWNPTLWWVKCHNIKKVCLLSQLFGVYCYQYQLEFHISLSVTRASRVQDALYASAPAIIRVLNGLVILRPGPSRGIVFAAQIVWLVFLHLLCVVPLEIASRYPNFSGGSYIGKKTSGT